MQQSVSVTAVCAVGLSCCLAGAGGSGVNFTDYIEFQHSDDGSGGEAEELLHPNGVSSSTHHPAEDWTWGKLMKDIWKVRQQQQQQRHAWFVHLNSMLEWYPILSGL